MGIKVVKGCTFKIKRVPKQQVGASSLKPTPKVQFGSFLRFSRKPFVLQKKLYLQKIFPVKFCIKKCLLPKLFRTEVFEKSAIEVRGCINRDSRTWYNHVGILGIILELCDLM